MTTTVNPPVIGNDPARINRGGAPKGNRNALKHGKFTAAAKAERAARNAAPIRFEDMVLKPETWKPSPLRLRIWKPWFGSLRNEARRYWRALGRVRTKLLISLPQESPCEFHFNLVHQIAAPRSPDRHLDRAARPACRVSAASGIGTWRLVPLRVGGRIP